MLTVTLLGGGVVLLVLKTGRKRFEHQDSLPQQTAGEFINVKDIKDKYLYTRDNMVLMFLRVYGVSIDLYSKGEKNQLIKALTAELSDIRYPFKFMAVSRPVDISHLIGDMSAMLKSAEDKRKELLRQEILQMSAYALSGEIVERQFYISLWEKAEDGCERELHKRTLEFSNKFTTNGIGCEVLNEKEIVRLCNLVNNPSYTHLEDTEFEASIPILKEDYRL